MSAGTSSLERKERLELMVKTCKNPIKYKNEVDRQEEGGETTTHLHVYEHAICDFVNRLGDNIKHADLGFDVKMWTSLREITAHHYVELDLSEMWADLGKETEALQKMCEEKMQLA